MPCRRRSMGRYQKAIIKPSCTLSYGMDSEGDETTRKMFAERKPEKLPQYLWRILIADAWMVWKIRLLIKKILIWLLLFLFLGTITALIIGPCKLYRFPQHNILRLDVEEQGCFNRHSELKFGKEINQFYPKKSQSNAIRFTRRTKLPEVTNIPLINHEVDENERSVSIKQLNNVNLDLKNKIVDLEKSLQSLGSAVEYLQMDFINRITTDELPEDGIIRKIVHEEIIHTEKEKLGYADFALESSGGSIIGTPNTKTYASRTVIQLFGFPLWCAETSPRNAIQADTTPGECWAFGGSVGNLRIRLAAPAILNGFSLYHIPQQISISGEITSAPREFYVVGINEANYLDPEVLLGEYEYNTDGTPQQEFLIQREVTIPFSIIELRIHSNHGHPEYTCLYRFQVHGRLA